MHIEFSPEFVRQFKKLPRNLQLKAAKAENIFRKNIFDARIKTHKLSGKYRKYLAFSISYSHRIIFSFVEEKKIRFHSVGDHDIYN